MANKFNFAQMADSPVVKDANETMTKAFEQKAENKSEAKQGGVVPTSEKPKVEQTEVQQFPTVNNGGATMLTAQRRNEKTMTMDDHLRDEWMQYLGVFAGSLTVGANVQLPEGIDDRLDAISKRMRGVVGTVKMPKKNLILLAVWEFVEKYDK